jgi:SAM-dependent methyltransferase
MTAPERSSALERWRRDVARWGIPDEILSKAPESPWGFPVELFRVRAGSTRETDPTSTIRAREALAEAGSVLDVGVGGGAASLPLADRASLIVGVDPSEEMLASFREAARARGVATEEITGVWPDVEARAPPADVVVCHHVLYNGTDIERFVPPLDAHARRRVVIEMTPTHPLAWMSDLWRRFHGLERPRGPTADDALEALRELGLDARREDETVDAGASGFEHPEDAVALVRRRLCLPADRDEELRAALGDRLVERDGLWSTGPAEETLVTLWWDARR